MEEILKSIWLTIGILLLWAYFPMRYFYSLKDSLIDMESNFRWAIIKGLVGFVAVTTLAYLTMMVFVQWAASCG